MNRPIMWEDVIIQCDSDEGILTLGNLYGGKAHPNPDKNMLYVAVEDGGFVSSAYLHREQVKEMIIIMAYWLRVTDV